MPREAIRQGLIRCSFGNGDLPPIAVDVVTGSTYIGLGVSARQASGARQFNLTITPLAARRLAMQLLGAAEQVEANG